MIGPAEIYIIITCFTGLRFKGNPFNARVPGRPSALTLAEAFIEHSWCFMFSDKLIRLAIHPVSEISVSFTVHWLSPGMLGILAGLRLVRVIFVWHPCGMFTHQGPDVYCCDINEASCGCA